MKLTDFLNAGRIVAGSKFDGKIPNLKDMSPAAQKRNGYLGADGYWTDRAWDRMTTVDVNQMHRSTKARAQNKG